MFAGDYILHLTFFKQRTRYPYCKMRIAMNVCRKYTIHKTEYEL